MNCQVIIVSPSLDPKVNVSGISSVVRYIIEHCKTIEFVHFELGRKDNEGGKYRIFSLIAALIEWMKVLSKEKKALIHYNFAFDTKGIVRDFFFISLAKFLKRKLVLHIHGGKYMNDNSPSKLLNTMIKRILKGNKAIIVLSNKEKSLIEQKYNLQDVCVLPNPIEVPVSGATDKIYDNDGTHFLYLGRIEKNKGIEEMLDAFSKLKETEHSFKLHLAGKEQGEDNYIERFKTALDNSFIYEGVVSGNDKDELLRKCHVFLLPSYYEGLPMSLLETMSYGMVPIVTEVGSIGDYVVDGKNGMIVNVGDAKSLYDTVIRILGNRKIINNLSKEAYETMRNYFSKEEYIDKLNEIYIKVRK